MNFTTLRHGLVTIAVWALLASAASAQLLLPGQKVSLNGSQSAATISVAGETNVLLQLQGTWTGTVVFEGSLDGSTFSTMNMTPLSSTTPVTSSATNGIWTANIVGVNYVRARLSAFSSGSVQATFQTFYVSGGGGGGSGSGGSVSIVQGGNTAAVNGSSQLSVNCANCTGSGVSQQDNTGFVAGTTNFVPNGGTVDDVGTTAVNEDSAGAVRITPQRAFHMNLRTSTGTEAGTASVPLQVSLANTSFNPTALNFTGTVQPGNTPNTTPWLFQIRDAAGNARGANVNGSNQLSVSVDGTNAATQSGTWTVQPGNTPNTSPWLFSISQGGNTAQVNASSQLSVVCANCTGSGVSQVDNTGYTASTTVFVPSGGFVGSTAVTAGNAGAFQMDTARNLFVNLSKVGGTATDTNSGVKSAGTIRVVLATDQPQLTNKLLVTPDANSAINVAQVGGSNVATASAGIMKVGLTDASGTGFTANSGRLPVLADINNGSTTVTEAATLTANQASVALADSVLYAFDGTTDSRLRSRAGLVGSTDVGLVTRPFAWSDGTNTAPTMDAVARPGFQKITDGTNTMPTMDAVARPGFLKVTDGTNTMADPCTFLPWNHVAISQATATVTQYIAAATSKKNYICAIVLVAGAAEIVNLVEGTGANCGTGTAALVGSTTAAQGMSFAANGGFVNPVKISGIGTNVNTCIATSGANRVAGYLEYVQQ